MAVNRWLHRVRLARASLAKRVSEKRPFRRPGLRNQSPSAQRPARLALVGCGWFANLAHTPALRRLEAEGLFEVTALCSRSESSLKRSAELLGRTDLKLYRELSQLLADPDVDAVDLVLPIPLMPDAVAAALEAGKHVVSEKPAAPSVDAGLALIDTYERYRATQRWCVAENWRFKDSVRLVAEIVHRGEIGTPHFAHFRNLGLVERSAAKGWRGAPAYQGGHLLDAGVHFVAMLRSILGEIDEVAAFASQRQPYLPPADSLHGLLSFECGAEGSFALSFGAREPDIEQPDLSIVGSDGALHASFKLQYVDVQSSSGSRTLPVPDDSWNAGGVYQTLRHFGAMLRSERMPEAAPISTPEEALRDVAVIEAMLESSRKRASIRPRVIPR